MSLILWLKKLFAIVMVNCRAINCVPCPSSLRVHDQFKSIVTSPVQRNGALIPSALSRISRIAHAEHDCRTYKDADSNTFNVNFHNDFDCNKRISTMAAK
jgi:hypothetical protein